MKCRFVYLAAVAAGFLLTACSTGGDNASAPALVNQASDLAAVLERGTLGDACPAYRAAPDNRELMLKCGKYMFFYEGFDTPGVPLPLLTTLVNNLPEHVGPGFAKLG